MVEINNMCTLKCQGALSSNLEKLMDALVLALFAIWWQAWKDPFAINKNWPGYLFLFDNFFHNIFLQDTLVKIVENMYKEIWKNSEVLIFIRYEDSTF